MQTKIQTMKKSVLVILTYSYLSDNLFYYIPTKIPLDTTYFPTQEYKIPYHATNVIFSLSTSYIFYPPRKNPAPDDGF